MEEPSTSIRRPTFVSETRFNQRSEELPALLECKRELQEGGYHARVIGRHLAAQQHFLAHLAQLNISPQAVRESDVEDFLRTKLQQYCARHGHQPRDIGQWRTRYTAAIYRVLRAIQGQWPSEGRVLTKSERFQRELLDGYGRWLTEVCGLSSKTLCKNSRAARIFLHWLEERASTESLAVLNVADIDAFFSWRMPGLRRATRHGVCQCLRSFLRYLHASNRSPGDLRGFDLRRADSARSSSSIGILRAAWHAAAPASAMKRKHRCLRRSVRREIRYSPALQANAEIFGQLGCFCRESLKIGRTPR